MTEKLIGLLKDGSVVIPKILLTNYKGLNLDANELIFLIYIINYSDFNPENISKELNIKSQDVLTLINSLSQKDIIKIKNKTVNNIREEYISLDGLYNKLALMLIDEESTEESTIYDVFEREFGRTLSSMEYEIIGAWLDQKFTDEIIILALKEAVYNGVYKLNYIDKILYTWRKKGLNNKDDILKYKNSPKEKKTRKVIDDYDWLNE